MKKPHKGDDVTWKWGQGTAEGKVVETFDEDVTRTIKGKKITRKADVTKPAVLVRQEDGAKALKSASEITRKR